MTIKFIFTFSIFLVFSMSVSSFYVAYADQTIRKSAWDVMSDKVCRDKLCSKISSDYVEVLSSSIAHFSPPLKQISQGIDPSNVTCTEGEVLIWKQSNGFSACVNPSSVEKLITRGWAVHILSDYIAQNNNSEIFAVGNHSIISETVTYFADVFGYLAKPVGIPIDTVIEFESSLNELDVENHIYVYDDVDHAFANPSGARYAPEESVYAWVQTTLFQSLL